MTPEAKYCPIILMNQGYHRQEEQYCVRQACAWWVDATASCCVRTLAVIPTVAMPTVKPAPKKGK